jgi:hypothetical protein
LSKEKVASASAMIAPFICIALDGFRLIIGRVLDYGGIGPARPDGCIFGFGILF